MLLLLNLILLVVISYMLGYYHRDIQDNFKRIKVILGDLLGRKDAPQEPTGTVVDPDDPVQAAKAEFDAVQRKLNK